MIRLLRNLFARGYVSPAEADARVGAAVAMSRRQMRRSYAAAGVSRLTADFTTSLVSADTDLVRSLRTMRARSRDLFKNDPYCRRFIRLVEKNVIGPAGIVLVPRAVNGYGADGQPILDRYANAVIAEGWARWGKPALCTVDRRTSWLETQRELVRLWAMDGEAFTVFEPRADHPFGFVLRVLSADYLDEDANGRLPGGNTLRLGVEFDAGGGVVAYHFFATDPNDWLPGSMGRAATPRVRIPAERVAHLYTADLPDQTRGVPWLFAAIARLNMLGGYEEAELVASRVAANKLGFLVMPEGEEYPGEGTDCQGYTTASSEPGTVETVPHGTDMLNFDPQHPNANFAAFIAAMLRGVACAGDVSFHSLTGDLSQVNYSSARIGLLDERDGYMTLQGSLMEQVHDPLFSAWLASALAFGAVPLPVSRFDKFNAPTWRPRRWAWVDPAKEVKAAADAVALRIKSRAEIIQETGRVPEVVWAELAAEEALLKEAGLLVEPVPPEAAPPEAPDPEDGEEAPPPRRNGHARALAG